MEIQVISGFLGAGKTTFLNRYLPLLGGTTAVIENEFGDVGIDGEMIEGDIPVHVISAGCICCSLALDFRRGIKEIAEKFNPERIIIEPSGVGRLSDIIKACQQAREKDGIPLRVTKLVTIVDIASFEDYAEGFGAFYLDQIQNAGLIFPTHMNQLAPDKKKQQMDALRELNPGAILYDGDFREMDKEAIMELIALAKDYEEKSEKDLGQNSSPSFPADKVFTSVSILNPPDTSREQLEKILAELEKEEYGQVLRAKGILKISGDRQIHFDYTPFSSKWGQLDTSTDYRNGKESKAVVIGCALDEMALRKLFECP